MYRLFYPYHATGDILYILIDPEEKTIRSEKHSNVVACYGEKGLAGINFFSISDTVKIKAEGAIFAPSEALLAAVNPLIENAGLPALHFVRDSSYKIATITELEEHPLDEKGRIVTLSLGEGKILTTVSFYPNLARGAKVVVLLDGGIAYNGRMFRKFISKNIPSECSICSAKELRLGGDSAGAYLVKSEEKEGTDFFYGE